MSLPHPARSSLTRGASFHFIRLVAIAIAALFATAVSATSMPSRPVAAQAESKSKPILLGGPHDTPAFRTSLPRVTDKEMAAIGKSTKRPKFHQTGIGRNLAVGQSKIGYESLAWITATNGVRYTTLEFESAGAAAIRLSIEPKSLPKGVSLYVYGTWMPELIYGPYTGQEIRAAGNDPYWLPVIEGGIARVELHADSSTNLYGKALSVPKVSHLTKSIRGNGLKDLADIGKSGSCNIDIACTPPSSAAWVTVGNSVAKYVLTDASGASGTCTGTLIASSGSSPPNYFVTARHCIDSIAAADSMHFYWFFQRTTCNGPNPTTVTQTTGGATFINAVIANDMTLVRLNNNPPSGSVLAGWNTTPITAGATVVALHHPSGDLKKFSLGANSGSTSYLGDAFSPTADHMRVLWSQGTTEPGSSGSGLFDSTGALVGTLHGGDAACGANQGQPDWYGRFDQASQAFLPWLSPGAGGPPPPQPPPAFPFTELTSGVAVNSSVQMNSSKWYRIQTSATSTNLAVTLSNMNADGDLWVYKDSQNASPTCVSRQAGTENDTCNVPSPGAASWFIEVEGYESTNFRLTATVTDPSSGGGIGSGGGGRGGGRVDFLLLALLAFVSLTRLNHKRVARA